MNTALPIEVSLPLLDIHCCYLLVMFVSTNSGAC